MLGVLNLIINGDGKIELVQHAISFFFAWLQRRNYSSLRFADMTTSYPMCAKWTKPFWALKLRLRYLYFIPSFL